MLDWPTDIPIKKLKDGFEMPVFGAGTWRMGGDFRYDPDNDDGADIRAKMRGVKHIEENLGAVGWHMEEGDIERLRREFPDQKDVSDAVPLI